MNDCVVHSDEYSILVYQLFMLVLAGLDVHLACSLTSIEYNCHYKYNYWPGEIRVSKDLALTRDHETSCSRPPAGFIIYPSCIWISSVT